MRLREYIHYLLSREQYGFSYEAFREISPRSETAIKFELARLVAKGEIQNVRKGFYVIIPPRYAVIGKLPLHLYAEALFRSLQRPYYMGLYTAARFHGSAHQQVQQDFVVIERPKMPDIRKPGISLRFFTGNVWSEQSIEIRQGDGGIFRISDPALTAMDLIHHQSKIGGMGRVYTVIEELTEVISPNHIQQLLNWYPNKSDWQRLGFLLENIQADNRLVEPIRHYLKNQNIFPVLLSPGLAEKPLSMDHTWKVNLNVVLESDL